MIRSAAAMKKAHGAQAMRVFHQRPNAAWRYTTALGVGEATAPCAKAASAAATPAP